MIQGCIYLPHTSSVYDPACDVYERQMTLQVEQIGLIGNCSNQGCATLLVAAGVVSAATAVVSGSIVVVGNVVFWLEKKGQCPSR